MPILNANRNQVSTCSRTYWFVPLSFILISSTLLSACGKDDNVIEPLSPKTEASSQKRSSTTAKATETDSIADANKANVFAPIVEKEKHGIWLGGAAPHNKRASGIDTYYRIKAEDEPNHVTMTLRFEGITADDAKVEIKPIDGARFSLPDQQILWRLKPDLASQISFTLILPDAISYLAVDTYQNNQGSARAFELKTR